MLNSIKNYFAEFVKGKDAFIKKLVLDLYKNNYSNTENQKSKKELQNEICSLKKKRQKYMDIYENDVISIRDLNENTAEINNAITRCGDKLKIVECNISQGSQLLKKLTKTFKSVEQIFESREITNEMLKKAIERIK